MENWCEYLPRIDEADVDRKTPSCGILEVDRLVPTYGDRDVETETGEEDSIQDCDVGPEDTLENMADLQSIL
jgi:hypothetical protein